ncbi:unnamed protein product [Phytophthora lilii]|uniref:Unnamed protein product n=1 Tax=Phytophthora lilii TaxID=2077276 RepID=A0A9W6XRZ0_9STRA|nr:unnamed protein product [Phytophthora lilii]
MALDNFCTRNLSNGWLPEALAGPRMNFGSRHVLQGIVNAVDDQVQTIIAYEDEPNVLVQLAQTGYIVQKIERLNRLLDVTFQEIRSRPNYCGGPEGVLHLMNGYSGAAFDGSTPDYVSLPEGSTVAAVCMAAFNKFSQILSNKVSATELVVYNNFATYMDSEPRQEVEKVSGHVGKSEADPIVVVVPTVWLQLMNGYSVHLLRVLLQTTLFS